MLARMGRTNKVPWHAPSAGHDGCGVSTGRSIRAPHATHVNHERSWFAPPSRSPQSRCSRKKASKSSSSRASTATPRLRRSSRHSRHTLPLRLVDDRRYDAAAARAGRRLLELLWFSAKKGVGPRAHLSPTHRARERETGVAQRVTGRGSEEVGQRGEPVRTCAAATDLAQSVRSVREE